MESKKLLRSKTDRKIGGVCGGLATYFNIDPTIVRLVFVLSFFLLYQWTLLLYLMFLIVVPEEN